MASTPLRMAATRWRNSALCGSAATVVRRSTLAGDSARAPRAGVLVDAERPAGRGKVIGTGVGATCAATAAPQTTCLSRIRRGRPQMTEGSMFFAVWRTGADYNSVRVAQNLSAGFRRTYALGI